MPKLAELKLVYIDTLQILQQCFVDEVTYPIQERPVEILNLQQVFEPPFFTFNILTNGKNSLRQHMQVFSPPTIVDFWHNAVGTFGEHTYAG